MRAVHIIEPDCIVRLVGFEADPAGADEQFIAAWRTMAESDTTPGLLWRELSRQAPAWNEQIRAEIQNPNPFRFVDYAILRPDADLTRLARLPREITSRYRLTEGLFRVVFHLVRGDAIPEPPVQLFNMFEVDGPPEMEAGFVAGWAPRGSYQAQQPAFASAMLHQRRDRGVRIAAFNRAEWRDVAEYAAGIADFARAFPVVSRGGAPTGGAPRCAATSVSSSGWPSSGVRRRPSPR